MCKENVNGCKQNVKVCKQKRKEKKSSHIRRLLIRGKSLLFSFSYKFCFINFQQTLSKFQLENVKKFGLGIVAAITKHP